MTSDQVCQLCCEKKKLRESHIIPKFVADWLKESSGTGFLRSSEMPNRRVQDSMKERMLCADCETLLNRWETPFAAKIFHPLNRREAMQFKYASWLLKFAVSVSWRVLVSNEAEFASGIPDHGRALIAKTLKTWKEFLLDLRPHPGAFEQHMIFTDMIKMTEGIEGLPPNWNRFLTRGSHINMAHSAGHPLYVYTKMGRVTLLGFIGMKYPRQWVGTKIHVREGIIGGSITVPIQFLDYMKERATKELNEQEKLSERQLEVIEAAYRKNSDRAVASETLLALDQDVRLFGKDKVFGKNHLEEKDIS